MEALNARAERLGILNHRGRPIRFVPQSRLPSGIGYEAFISATGCVPTRENLHDFFNALIWLTFPNIKVRLNALQAAEIERAQAPTASGDAMAAGRGLVRDAATLFDENAALLVVRDPTLLDALREHRWEEVFLERRSDFSRDCAVQLFGHALMEKLVHPYNAITAHTWTVAAARDFFTWTPTAQAEWIDLEVAARLSDSLAPRDFTPMPILGVPGWWEGQDAAFYGDRAVFRPKRAR